MFISNLGSAADAFARQREAENQMLLARLRTTAAATVPGTTTLPPATSPAVAVQSAAQRAVAALVAQRQAIRAQRTAAVAQQNQQAARRLAEQRRTLTDQIRVARAAQGVTTPAQPRPGQGPATPAQPRPAGWLPSASLEDRINRAGQPPRTVAQDDDYEPPPASGPGAPVASTEASGASSGANAGTGSVLVTGQPARSQSAGIGTFVGLGLLASLFF